MHSCLAWTRPQAQALKILARGETFRTQRRRTKCYRVWTVISALGLHLLTETKHRVWKRPEERNVTERGQESLASREPMDIDQHRTRKRRQDNM